MQKRWFWLSVLLVVLSAFVLRFYKLGQIPTSLYWDEIAMLVDARSVAETGQDMHGNSWLQTLYPSYGDYKLPVYLWLAALSVKFFGATEWALRLPSALAGVGTALLSMGLAWQLFDQQKQKSRQALTLITGLAIAISPWSMMFSRTAFEGHLGQFLVGLSVYFLFLSRKKKSWLFWLAIPVGALATYAYFSVRFVWPVIFTLFVLLFGNKQEKTKLRLPPWASVSLKPEAYLNLKKLLLIAFGLLIYAGLMYPMTKSLYYAASNQFRLSTTSVLNMKDWPLESNILREQAGNTFLSRITYHRHILLLKELVKNYSDNLSLSFLFLNGDPNLRHGTGKHGLFLWIFLPSLLIGLYQMGKNHGRKLLLLIIWWLIALLPASVPEGTPHALRSLNALIPLTLIIGYGTWAIWDYLLAQKNKLIKTSLISLVVILFLAVSFEFCQYYFRVYPRESAADWHDGYKQLAEFVWQKYQTEELDVVWIEPFDGRFHLWLMGYAMPVEQYRQLAYEAFIPQVIGEQDQLQIRFRWFDWGKLPTLTEKVLVVGEKKFIDEKLTEVPYEPEWYETIYTSLGNPEFAVIKFVRK